MEQKKHKTASVIAGVLVASVAALGIFLFTESRSDTFIYRTEIGGLDITDCTIDEAVEKVMSGYSEDTIALIEDGETDLEGTLGQFGYSIDEEDLRQTLTDLFYREKTDLQTLFLCELGAIKATEQIPFSFDESVFAEFVTVENLAVDRRAPQDAVIEYDADSGLCVIRPEIYGNEISDEALQSYVKQQLEAIVEGRSATLTQSNDNDEDGVIAINFPEDAISSPEILQDNNILIAECAALNEYAGSEIIYDFGEEQLVVDFGQIMDMLLIEVTENEVAESYGTDNESTEVALSVADTAAEAETVSGGIDVAISLDEEAVEDFVSDLAATYNTRHVDREFETSVGTTVTLAAKYCEYGYVIDQESEITQLKEELLSGKTVEREPIYYLTNSYGNPYFYKRNGVDDLAGTYVEVNLTQQHLWYYIDGELFIESDIVSGDISEGHGTQTGVFPLAYKESPSVLTGGQGDGEYETTVNYWMPFHEGQGLHDAYWRSYFGGSIYRYNGSHGCVNLPSSVAQSIYNNIEPGVAIVIYYE